MRPITLPDLAALVASQVLALVTTCAWAWCVWCWLAAGHPFK